MELHFTSCFSFFSPFAPSTQLLHFSSFSFLSLSFLSLSLSLSSFSLLSVISLFLLSSARISLSFCKTKTWKKTGHVLLMKNPRLFCRLDFGSTQLMKSLFLIISATKWWIPISLANPLERLISTSLSPGICPVRSKLFHTLFISRFKITDYVCFLLKGKRKWGKRNGIFSV